MTHDASARRPSASEIDRAAVIRNRTRAAARLHDHDFLYRHVAQDLAQRVRDSAGTYDAALCLGAMRGIVTDALSRMRRTGTLIAADAVGAMLPDDGPRLECDEERLPFPEGRFDLIVSFWGLHHVDDPSGMLTRMRRRLAPGGRFMAVFPGRRTLGALRDAFARADAEVTGAVVPRVHACAGLRETGRAMGAAGFAEIVVDRDPLVVTYGAPARLFADLRGTGEANALAARSRKTLRRDVLRRAEALLSAESGNGTVRALIDVCHARGRAPGGPQLR